MKLMAFPDFFYNACLLKVTETNIVSDADEWILIAALHI